MIEIKSDLSKYEVEMKIIGLIGGMSWESTVLYYQIINRAVQQRLGGLHSAKIILFSVDFDEIAELQKQDAWQKAGDYLAQVTKSLEYAGAECIVLCTNTMHKVTDQIEGNISVPFIHIADATAVKIKEQNIQKIGLLGTAFTMEQDFYKERLQNQCIEVVVPNESERKIIHDIIFQELCLGVINEGSKARYIDITNRLISEGVEGIILGCTEIGMLMGDVSFSVPTFDTTAIHAMAAVDFALS